MINESPVCFEYHDGGRAAAGFKGTTGDCGTRALAIALDAPYKEVYDLIKKYAKVEKPRKNRRPSHPRTGVSTKIVHAILTERGFRWVPLMKVGTGVKVHLHRHELPAYGRLVLRLSRHYAAYVDGVLYDTYVDHRDGTRAVYGYWIKDD